MIDALATPGFGRRPAAAPPDPPAAVAEAPAPVPPPAPSRDPAEEHRAASRQRTLLTGKLILDQRGIGADCTIRDLSDEGARVRVSASITLPKSIYLLAIREGRAYRADVAWRRGEEAGLRFTHAYASLGELEPDYRFIERLWKDLTQR